MPFRFACMPADRPPARRRTLPLPLSYVLCLLTFRFSPPFFRFCPGSKRDRHGKAVDERSSMASWLALAATSFGEIFNGKGVGYEDLVAEARRVNVSNGGLPSCADASRNLANCAHVDIFDAARSYAVWMRRSRGGAQVEGWWFLVWLRSCASLNSPHQALSCPPFVLSSADAPHATLCPCPLIWRSSLMLAWLSSYATRQPSRGTAGKSPTAHQQRHLR